MQTELVARAPEKEPNTETSAKHGVETVHSWVFAHPGSPLDRQSVLIIALTMNNAHWGAIVRP